MHPADENQLGEGSVVPLEPVRALCEQVFINLTFHAVDDGHQLRETVQAMDWLAPVG
jgi:hypothetical protein